jgi:hypothetical protein
VNWPRLRPEFCRCPACLARWATCPDCGVVIAADWPYCAACYLRRQRDGWLLEDWWTP